ncbi:MAG: DUF192 domain-containing protein [Chloroflexi bacterium]|nr:DUF192 domain-containing protein [Chloroflexota bacterium]MBI3741247.1 DUF192 domain-containing protein [Chloroflexota bacterium]
MNQTRAAILVDNGSIAASAWARLRGLLGVKSLARGDGLLLQGEQAIHTIGMRFAIDALFLDKNNRVVRIENAMPPLRLTPFVFRAAQVLELPAGRAAEIGTRVGDQIEIIHLA